MQWGICILWWSPAGGAGGLGAQVVAAASHPAWRCLRARMVAGRLGSTGAERFSSRSSVFLERASSAFLPGPLPKAPRRSDIWSSPCCPPAQPMEATRSALGHDIPRYCCTDPSQVTLAAQMPVTEGASCCWAAVRTREVCHGSNIERRLGYALRLNLLRPPGADRTPRSPDILQHTLMLLIATFLIICVRIIL